MHGFMVEPGRAVTVTAGGIGVLAFGNLSVEDEKLLITGEAVTAIVTPAQRHLPHTTAGAVFGVMGQNAHLATEVDTPGKGVKRLPGHGVRWKLRDVRPVPHNESQPRGSLWQFLETPLPFSIGPFGHFDRTVKYRCF